MPPHSACALISVLILTAWPRMGKGRQDHLSACLRFLQGYDSLVGDMAPKWHSTSRQLCPGTSSLCPVSILGPWLMQVFPRLLWNLRIAGLWTNLLHKAAHSAASQERLELPSPLPVPANQTCGAKLTVYFSLEVGWEAYSLLEQKQRGL